MKSHCEAPDVELYTVATSKKNALDKFCIKLNQNDYNDIWTPDMIERYVIEEKEEEDEETLQAIQENMEEAQATGN